MKIVKIRSYLKETPLKKAYSISYKTIEKVALVFLEIHLENGMIGYGSASPCESVVGETSYQSFENIQSEFVQKMVGKDIRNFQIIIYDTQQHFKNLPGTLAAIDIALHDAFTKYLGISVAQFYGQKMDGLPTSITIGIKNVQESMLELKEYFQLGFKIIKVKIGSNLEEDIERIKKIYENFGNSIKIRVDANQGYNFESLQKFIQLTKNIPLELIEQPFKVGQENELLRLSVNERKSIAADESLKNGFSALEFANTKPFGIYNIKLMKCGGIIGANIIATIAQQAQIDLFWGCNDESIISITAALHIAYSCGNTKFIDLDGSFDLVEDIATKGFTLKEGCLYLTSQSGLGVEVNN